MSLYTRALLQALFVTFLWSTSWVFIKIGLQDIPALTFAGLRYGLAFLFLLPFALKAGSFRVSSRKFFQLAALGLIMITVTQGAQFLALVYLPAITTSILLSFSPVLVAFLSMLLLSEEPSVGQVVGVGLYLVGATVYFYPSSLPGDELLGLAIAFVGLVANAGAAVLGRYVNREGDLTPLTVTVISMGVGSFVLLGAGVSVQGLPQLNLQGVLIVLWLAGVNTAFAFTLWNRTLRTLSAVESSVINNTMLIQIALLAFLFLGESLGAKEIIGLALAALGTVVVQVKRRSSLPHSQLRLKN